MNKQQLYFKNSFSLLLISVLSLLALNSCYKERFKLDKFSGGEWNPNIAAPLFFGELDMHYIVEKSADIWREDPDGLMSVVYLGEQVTKIGDKVITVPDQQTDTILPFILPPGLTPGDSTSQIFALTSEFIADSGKRVDSILVKDGKLLIEITTNINHDSYVEIIIPDFAKYGITFKEKVNLPYNGSSPTVVTKEIDLTDYWMVINKNGETDNNITEYIKVMIKKGSGPDNSPYFISLAQSLKDIKYFQAFGYFDQHSVSINLTKVDISLFDHNTLFDATIEDAILSLKFLNSYGMPVDMTFNDLYVEKNDGTRKDITSTLLPTTSLNYPDINNVGNSDTTNLVFNPQNSNIIEIVNFDPSKLFYSGVSITNPTSAIVPNFVIDTSRISLQAELEIPLYGRAIVYSLRDTSEIDLEDQYNWDEIVSVDINLNTDNYFPTEASLQIYLADTQMVIFDSLFTGVNKVVDAAEPGPPPAYRVTTPVHYMATAHLTDTKLKNLIKAKNIIISAKSSTFDNGNKIVKIYSDYKIGFEISAKMEYKTEY